MLLSGFVCLFLLTKVRGSLEAGWAGKTRQPNLNGGINHYWRWWWHSKKTEIKYPVSQLNITAEAVQQVKQYEGIET